MTRLVLAVPLLISYTIEAQCPLPATIGTSGNCPGAVLTADACQRLAKIVWYNNNARVDSAIANNVPAILTAAGGNNYGPAANQLTRPMDIIVDDSGNLYIADFNNGRVQKWAPCATSGVTVAGGNGTGTQPNQLNEPEGLWLDRSGNLYVSDNGSRVQKWAPGATSGVTVAGSLIQGRGADQLSGNLWICVDLAGNLYISDQNNNRIQKWAPGATSGVTVAGGFPLGAAPNQLNFPAGIFVDSIGNMYITDQDNNRVQKWAPGATAGVTVAGGNGAGSAPNQFNGPCNLWVDKAGNIYVTDVQNNRVQKWAPGATAGVTVAGGNGLGIAPNQLNEPLDVCVDGLGDIYVSDDFNFRVQEYTATGSITRTFIAPTAGNYSAVFTSPSGCSETTNSIPISPFLTPGLSLSGPAKICSGNTVTYTATPVNGGAAPSYQWQVNGQNIGNNSTTLSILHPNNHDTISCVMTSNVVCPMPPKAGDTLVPLTVYPAPVIDTGQVFIVQLGHGQALTPNITGDIATYSWSPANGLSNTSIGNPVADPPFTTLYELKVTSVDGCTANAAIKVIVQTAQVTIPNAFTPNGDGKNDIFFVLGAPAGVSINRFSIYNRLGQQVFSVKDVQPGDPAFGWNGYFQGNAAMAGTYVYVIELQDAAGKVKQLTGTVILVR